MRLGDRLDGHMVQGHVDCMATLTILDEQDGSWWLTFTYPERYRELLVEKGSVCVNGVSLTVAEVEDDTFPWPSFPIPGNIPTCNTSGYAACQHRVRHCCQVLQPGYCEVPAGINEIIHSKVFCFSGLDPACLPAGRGMTTPFHDVYLTFQDVVQWVFDISSGITC